MWRTSCFLLLVVSMAIFFILPVTVQSQSVDFIVVEPNEDELLLCSFSVEGELLSQELEVYVKKEKIFLPLGAVCRLIECGLDVDSGHGKASGYLWDEAHSFFLDMISKSVYVAGKCLPYDGSRVEAHRDDIYVDVSLLSEWFGMTIQTDRYDAAVILRPQTKLPVQLRLERERMGGKSASYGIEERSYYPRVENSYHFLDGYNLDFSVGASLSAAKGESSTEGSTYSALLTGDLLWMSGSLAVAGELDGSNFIPTSLYGVLRRMDPDGMLFGPLHATEISLGKVTAVLPSLLGASASGYGAAIGNYGLTSPSYFDLQTLSGPLLPGWDVELYRNDCYLDYRKADASGTYTFADIPLVFGTNVLRLEFHGPLGQKKSEEHTYNVGSNMTPPGNFLYRISSTAENGGGQFAFQTTYGLSKYLTATASALSGVFSDGRNLHALAGVAGYFSGLQFDASGAFDVHHAGFAADIGLRSQILSLGFSWRGTYYDRNWKMANASYTDPPYLARSILRADGLNLMIGGLYSSFSSTLASTLYREGDLYDLLTIRQYNTYKAFRLRNVFDLHHYFYPPASHVFYAEGYSAANARIRGVDLESACNYDIYPDLTLESLSFSIEATPFLSIQVSGAASYHFPSDLFSASISLYRDVSPFRFGLTGTWTTQAAFSVSLSVSTSIALDTRSDHVVLDSQNRASQGSISARVYLDTNYNKKWDEGERSLEGVGFIVNESSGEVLTDAGGNAILRGLSPNVPINVSIDEATLEDAFFVPAEAGVSCVLHPGTAARLDFPIWLTGEISGTVWAVEGNWRREIAGARVELLDSSNLIVGTIRSAYDGYFSFSTLKVGTYTVRLTKKNADGSVEYISRLVSIPPEGGYLDNIDLEYRPSEDTLEIGYGRQQKTRGQAFFIGLMGTIAAASNPGIVDAQNGSHAADFMY